MSERLEIIAIHETNGHGKKIVHYLEQLRDLGIQINKVIQKKSWESGEERIASSNFEELFLADEVIICYDARGQIVAFSNQGDMFLINLSIPGELVGKVSEIEEQLLRFRTLTNPELLISGLEYEIPENCNNIDCVLESIDSDNLALWVSGDKNKLAGFLLDFDILSKNGNTLFRRRNIEV